MTLPTATSARAASPTTIRNATTVKGAAVTTIAASAASSASVAPTKVGVEPGTLAVVTDPKLGAILTDGNGHVVYLFTVDTATASACGGTCVTTWPPLVGTPKAGTGLDATKLGTLKRSDGSVQVTYGGHPLYEHAKDAPGAATGEGANGNWFAISPAGTKA